jgi:ribosomal protein S18 acetylase RimI-like enzyme
VSATASVPLRSARPEDAPEIARLLVDFNGEFDEPAPPVEQLAERVAELLNGGDTVIALAAQPPCGLAVMRFRNAIWTPARECYLAELYVAPERRREGIGRALLSYTFELARAQNADYIDLNTAETDTAARALYESMGFSSTEHKPGGPMNIYYERGL